MVLRWTRSPTKTDEPRGDRRTLRPSPAPALPMSRLPERALASATALGRLRGGVRRDGGIRTGGLTRERDDCRADECQAEPDHGDDDMPRRSAEALVQDDDPDQDGDDGIRDRHRGNSRRQSPRPERDLLDDEAEQAHYCERIALPVGQHRAHALVEVVERWYRERR